MINTKLCQTALTNAILTGLFLLFTISQTKANVLTDLLVNSDFQFLNIETNAADTTDKEVFKVVEEMPRYPGCEDLSNLPDKRKCGSRKMLEFIYKNLEYPDEARKKECMVQ